MEKSALTKIIVVLLNFFLLTGQYYRCNLYLSNLTLMGIDMMQYMGPGKEGKIVRTVLVLTS